VGGRIRFQGFTATVAVPMMVDLAMLWVAGMVVAVPALLWWSHDVARIPGPAWYWTGHHRRSWQWGLLFGWIAGGWPAIVIVIVWSQSAVRRDVRDEAHEVRAARHRTSGQRR